jgi:hypothetical protein
MPLSVLQEVDITGAKSVPVSALSKSLVANFWARAKSAALRCKSSSRNTMDRSGTLAAAIGAVLDSEASQRLYFVPIEDFKVFLLERAYRLAFGIAH